MDMPESTRTVTVCPFCGHRHEMMRAVTPETTPLVGDYNVCFDCKKISIFDRRQGDSGWLVRKPTLAEKSQPYFVELSVLAAGYAGTA